MKKLILIFTLLYVSSAVADEYVRSIRVASFYTQERAEKAIPTLERLSLDFQACSENIIYRVRKIGRYYVLLVEPFRNKLLLQGTLDKIRILYPDAYVSKYKKTDTHLPFALSSHKQGKMEKSSKKAEKLNPPKVIIKEVEKIKTVTKVVVKKEYIESQYKILFYSILALFIGMVLFFIMKISQKREKEPMKQGTEDSSLEVEKEIILEDEFDDIDDLDLDLDVDFEESIDALDLLGETRENLQEAVSSEKSLSLEVKKLIKNSKVSIEKIQEYSAQNREKEMLQEILLLKALSESLALYLNETLVESMNSESLEREVSKITKLLEDVSRVKE